MQISSKKIQNLNELIQITVTKDDYIIEFDKQIKEYTKKADFKGFRKGMVPLSFVKKMYGNSLLIDSINKIVDKGLKDYVTENKLDLLGSAIPSESQENLDFDCFNQKDYTIELEIGISPTVDIKAEKIVVDKFDIDFNDKLVLSELDNVKKYFKTNEDSKEALKESDIVYFDISNNKSLSSSSFLSTDELTENGKKLLLGKNIEDKITCKLSDILNVEKFNFKKYIFNQDEKSIIAEDEYLELMDLTITNIKSVNIPTELSEEKITQVTRDKEKKTLDDLKEFLSNDMKKQYEKISQNFLLSDIQKYLIEDFEIELPTEFLKKFVMSQKENKIDDEEFEKQKDSIFRYTKWDVIVNNYAKANDLKIEYSDITTHFENIYRDYFSQMNMTPEQSHIDSFVAERMKDQNGLKKVYEQLMDEKILKDIASKCSFNSKVISAEEFIEKTKQYNS